MAIKNSKLLTKRDRRSPGRRMLESSGFRAGILVFEAVGIVAAIWALWYTVLQTQIALDSTKEQQRFSAYELLANSGASPEALWNAAAFVLATDHAVSNVQVGCLAPLQQFMEYSRRHSASERLDYSRAQCGRLGDLHLADRDGLMNVIVRDSSANLMMFMDPVLESVSFEGSQFIGTEFFYGLYDTVEFKDSNLIEAVFTFDDDSVPTISFNGSNLSRSTFSGDLRYVTFSRSNITSLNLCRFECSTVRSTETFARAYFDARLPPIDIDKYPSTVSFGYECQPDMLEAAQRDGPEEVCTKAFGRLTQGSTS